MELRQLEAFAAVMSTGSVTAAGLLLGRSQPAVSRLVQELEAEIGYELFARNGPRVTPTEQGFLLYEDVEHALTGLQQIRRRAKEIEQGLRRPVRVVATTALGRGAGTAGAGPYRGRRRHGRHTAAQRGARTCGA
ncbi:LysR family transcriptional regulator [Alicycliphilus sp. B1]|nr:LysR family transcriptional regulator [Alicycliphilus sp. B1]